MRKLQQTSDRVLFSAVLLMLMLGVLIVYSSSSFWGAERHGSSLLYMKNHVFRVIIGLIVLLWVSQVDYHRIRIITPILLLVSVGSLIAVFLLPAFHGTHRSLLIFGNRFQPSELMKLVMICYLAAVFAKGARSEIMEAKRWIFHYGFLLLVAALVFLEPDLGSAMVLFIVGFSMFFIAGVSWGHFAKMVWGIIPLIACGMVLFPYQRRRIADFYQSVFGNGEMGYQVKQSLIGLANGGVTGVGYGEGRQKLLFLPEPFSDFILASLGEELGFIGMMVVFTLLLIILWRGVRISMRAPDRYGFLLAGGVTAMILVNAVINAGVVLNVLPTTGLTFPFISYGGSSLLVQLAGVGILLNISRKAVTPFTEFTSERSRKVLSQKQRVL